MTRRRTRKPPAFWFPVTVGIVLGVSVTWGYRHYWDSVFQQPQAPPPPQHLVGQLCRAMGQFKDPDALATWLSEKQLPAAAVLACAWFHGQPTAPPPAPAEPTP